MPTYQKFMTMLTGRRLKVDFACSSGSATNTLCNAGTRYSFQKISEAHQEFRQWKAQQTSPAGKKGGYL
jgi:hypothetical protein